MTVQSQIESPDALPSEQETAVAANGPRLYGVIDILRPDRIAGWAIDRSDSAAAVDVEVFREGRVVARVRADRHRADLEKGGIGTGNYGFRAEIDPPLEPGFEFTIAAFCVVADGSRGELKRVGAAARAPGPDQRLLERIFTAVTEPAPPPPPPQIARQELERLNEAVARIEVAQARLEAVLAGVEPPAVPPRDGGLKAMVAGAVVFGIVSLGVGLYSLFAG